MKKVISFLLAAMIFTCGVSPVIAADGGNNIFKGIDANLYTSVETGNAVVESDGSVFTSGAGTAICYRNVSFDKKVTHMELTYSTQEYYEPRVIEFKLDSADGETIASFTLRETVRYTNVVTDRAEVNFNAVGSHDLYMVDVNGSAGRIYGFKMYGMWDETDLSEEDDFEFNNKQKLLKSLGITESNKSADEAAEFISRKDYAKIICKTFKIPETSGNPFNFDDVTDDCGYINSLVQNGYLKATGGFVRPDDKIGLADVAEGFMRMSGYGVYLKETGNTRESILAAAVSCGFMKNMQSVINKYTTYADIVNLTANMLMLDAVDMKYGTDTEISFKSKVNILENLFDVKKSTGIVTANKYTALSTGDMYEPTGAVKIDGVSYDAGISGAENYLGYRLNFYYMRTMGDRDEILYIYGMDTLNEVVKVNSDDIISHSGNTIYFTKENGKEDKETIPNDADFIYNGVSCSNYTEKQLDVNDGYISFTDNDSDGKWDVVSVKSGDVYVVDGVDVANDYIYPKSGDDFAVMPLTKIDLSSDKTKYATVMLDGVKSDLDALKSGYTVTVYDSVEKNGYVRMRTVEASSKTVNGVLSSYNSDGEYCVDEIETYEKSDSCLQTPEIGARYTLHISTNGKISWFESSPQTRRYLYGFVMKTSFDENAIDDEVQIKLLDENSAVKVYSVSKKATIDGYAAQNGKRAWELILNGDEKFIPQLIRYKLDGDGKINMIDTSYVSPNEDKTETMKRTLRYQEADYRNMMDYFWQVAPVSDDTVIFAVPFRYDELEEDISEYKDADYIVMKNARQYAGINQYSEGYDGSVVKPLGAIVKYKNPVNTVSESSPMIYITKKTNAVNEDGDETVEVTGIYNGNMTKLVLTEYAAAEYGDLINAGDLWLFQKDAKGRTAYMMPIWMKNEPADYQMSYDLKKAAITTGNLYICLGTEILDKYKNNISMNVLDKECGFSLNDAQIVQYDTASKTMKKITVEQIAKNSQTEKTQYAFLYAYAKQTKHLIIINE